jgi:hypothetical protein
VTPTTGTKLRTQLPPINSLALVLLTLNFTLLFFFSPTPSLSPQRAVQGTENRQVVVGVMVSTQLGEGWAQPSSSHATHVTAERKPR